MDSKKSLLFIGGAPRSATSELVNLLNEHDKIFIGQERYFNLFKLKRIRLSHFDKKRFTTMYDCDTHQYGGLHIRNKDAFAKAPDKFDAADIIGDKYTRIFESFDEFDERLEQPNYIYIYRNPISVAQSFEARFKNKNDTWHLNYKDSINVWNNSIVSFLNAHERIKNRAIVIEQESFFSDTNLMSKFFNEIGVESISGDILRKYNKRFKKTNETLVERRDDIRSYICKNADWDSYKRLLSHTYGDN